MLEVIVKFNNHALLPNSPPYKVSMIFTNSLVALSRSTLRTLNWIIFQRARHSSISPTAFFRRTASWASESVFLLMSRDFSSVIEGGQTKMKLVSGKAA